MTQDQITESSGKLGYYLHELVDSREKGFAARIAELEEALRPFAEIRPNLHSSEFTRSMRFQVYLSRNEKPTLTGEDLIRAREILNKGKRDEQ